MKIKIKQSTIEDILYVAADGQETLLVKVRGRGWFKSSGANHTPGLSPRRLGAWLSELNTFGGWQRTQVQHFHLEKKNK